MSKMNNLYWPKKDEMIISNLYRKRWFFLTNEWYYTSSIHIITVEICRSYFFFCYTFANVIYELVLPKSWNKSKRSLRQHEQYKKVYLYSKKSFKFFRQISIKCYTLFLKIYVFHNSNYIDWKWSSTYVIK